MEEHELDLLYTPRETEIQQPLQKEIATVPAIEKLTKVHL